jgi:hypothetical protein
MADIDLELRMQLMRARPKLSLAHADSLIRGVTSSCLDVRDDARACGEVEHQDFVTFCHVDGVALAAVFGKSAVEFFGFAADESFIRDAEHLAMVEVQEFMQLARSRLHVPDEGLVLPMSQALPWMEQHRKAERDGESKHVA